jgi:hypothetical protein
MPTKETLLEPREGEQSLAVQESSALTVPTNEFELLALAIREKSAIDVIERLTALRDRAEDRAIARLSRDAEIGFTEALVRCQEEARLVINDSDKTAPGGKKWATYKAIDREIRPIYIRNGFSLSFGSAECSIPGYMSVTCLVSRGLHTRLYQLPMEISGQGPQGGGALSKPHAILAGMEYGRRCLVKSIFNLVTGDEDLMTNGELQEHVEWIQNAKDREELMSLFKQAYSKFEAAPSALKVIIAAKNKRKEDFE